MFGIKKMDKVNQKMKKFNLRGVLDGIRSSVSTPPKPELSIEESLRSDHFQLAKTVCHGFPYQPTAMAYDAVQNILAIGTKCGRVRIFGRPGVDCQINHNEGCAVIQILFLINEGGLLTVGDNDTVYLWTLRQKYPEIVHSLKFQRERITCCHLPFQSKWLYIGTKNGNVHIINIECFVLSGYIINWNKAIELTRKTHPGSVVHLSDCPNDPNKLLIGFESGAVVLWDLKNRVAESRYNCTEPLRSISWHHEGKQFMCSHTDGSLTVWTVRFPQKPQNLLMPHAKLGKDGKPEPCIGITKVEWKSVRNSEPYIIFSGGMPVDRVDRSPSITVMHVKSTTVLEMEHDIVDFITLCPTPWNHDFQDPTAIVVLLTNDLVVVDLTSSGYPCFENPYPMDIHESPVTACIYLADCPTDLIPAFYSVGSKQKKSGYSEKDWPVKGGEWGTPTCSYPELIITGHADGSVKFWDASAVTLQVLYKLKTAKLFDKSKCSQPDSDDDPFAIQLMHLCAESRLFCVAGLSHVILFRFSKQEATIECPYLDVSIVYEIYDELDSPSVEYPPIPPKPSIGSTSQSGSIGSYSSVTSDGKDKQTSVTLKNGSRKWSMGYQPDLCVVLNWIDGEPAPPVASISLNSSYGLLAFGNECGIAIIDIVQRTCLLNMGTPDLYGSMDPYSRAPRSPKNKTIGRPQGLEGLSQNFNTDDVKSPSQEQSEHECLTFETAASQLLETIEETYPSRDGTNKTAKQFRSNESDDLVQQGQHHGHCGQASGSNVAESKRTMEIHGNKSITNSDDQVLQNISHTSVREALYCHETNKVSLTTSGKINKAGNTKQAEQVNSGGLSSAMDPGNSRYDGETSDSYQHKSDEVEAVHLVQVDNREMTCHRSSTSACVEEHHVADPAKYKRSNSLPLNKNGTSKEFMFTISKCDDVSPSAKKDITSSAGEGMVSTSGSYQGHPLDGTEVLQMGGGGDATCTAVGHSLSDSHITLGTNVVSHVTEMDEQEPLYIPPNRDYCTRSEKPEHYKKSRRSSLLHKLVRRKDHESEKLASAQAPIKLVRAVSEYSTTDVNLSAGMYQEKHKSDPYLSTSADYALDKAEISQDQTRMRSFVRRVTARIRHSITKSEDVQKRRKNHRFEMIDLTAEDVPSNPPCRKMSYRDVIQIDKSDGSFSRSRSSSMSSLENVSKESIQCLTFADAFTRKTDTYTYPCLWVGTVLGSVLVISINLPDETDRKTQPVIVSPSGTIFRMKGSILAMSFLDCNGFLIPAVAEQWRECTREERDSKKPYNRQQSVSSMKSRMSPTSSQDITVQDRQLAILCSEKQARVISLPSQTCAYKVKITETSVVAKADVIGIKDSVCLGCYVANGHVMIFSLPSLKPLLDVHHVPMADVRVAKTFCFSNNGHALYFCSPTELQKITFSAKICENLKEMLGDLFLPTEPPNAPKQNFLKSLFTGGPATLDREELFGEGSGKASKGVVKYTAGMGQMQEKMGVATSEIGRAKMAAIERGQHLSELEEASAKMRNEAESYSQHAHQLMQKYRDKKWYQF